MSRAAGMQKIMGVTPCDEMRCSIREPCPQFVQAPSNDLHQCSWWV